MSGRLALLLPALVLPVALSGQLNHRADHVLNVRGQSRVTLATGIPYVAIAEYAYGVSDRVTVGLMAGTTPAVEGVGIRARAVLYEPHPAFRIYFCTPVFFYPKTKGLGGDAWWLTRPNINFEWQTVGGLRAKVGGSVILAASHRTLFGDPATARFAPGVWNAVHAGVSLPVGARTTLQAEVSGVMRGLRAAENWVGGPPVIVVLGVGWTL